MTLTRNFLSFRCLVLMDFIQNTEIVAKVAVQKTKVYQNHIIEMRLYNIKYCIYLKKIESELCNK